MANRKFQIGDRVRIAAKYKDKYNCITTTGTVLDIDRHFRSGRCIYLVQFEGKKFKTGYKSYELELDVPSMMLKSPKMKESQKISDQLLESIEKAIDTKNQKIMKKKFQIGDRVLIKSGREKGNFGTVEKEIRSRSGRIVYNVFIQKELYKANRDYYSYNLELVSKPKTTQAKEKKEQQHFRMGDSVRLSDGAKKWLKENDPNHEFIQDLDGSFTVGRSWVDKTGRTCYAISPCAVLGLGKSLKFHDEDLVEDKPVQYKVGDRVILTQKAKDRLSVYDKNRVFVKDPDAVFTIKTVGVFINSRICFLKEVLRNKCGCTVFFFDKDLKPAPVREKIPRESNPEYANLNKREYINRLSSDWKELCNRYLQEFCIKHEFKYEPDMWVGDDPGTIVEVCDMFVSMENIRYDVDNNVPEDTFAKWYWKNLELYELGVEHWMNYPSYCKGAPDEWTEERIARLKDSKKRLDEAEQDFKRVLNEEITRKNNFGGLK